MSAIKLYNLKIKRRELWWHEYRRRKFRQRRKYNMEMALRDIFKQCFVEYTKNSSVAAFKQMTDPKTKITIRLMWLVGFGLMCGIGGYFLWYLWFGSLSSPLIVNMESSKYPISKIEFPAVAICNVNIISKKALLELEWNDYKTNVSGNITYSRARQLGRLLDYSYHGDIKSILHDYLTNNDAAKYAPKIISTMKKLAPKCKEMLLMCFWAGKEIDCESIFESRRTNKGFCCTFNYVLNYNAAETPSNLISQAKRQHYPGPLFGLNLLIDPLIEDYSYNTRPAQGVEILMFDPTHYADPNSGRVSQRLAQPGQALHLSLSSTKQLATPEVRKYSPETRKCLFHDEHRKQYKDMYSYSACIYNCRIKTIHALCGCTPYAFPIVSDMPTCTLNDLSCLDKIKERLLLIYPIGSENTEGLDREFQDSLYCPQCHPDCEFTKHESKSTKITYQNQYIKTFKLYNTASHINITNKCFVSIYQSSFHGTLNRLDVVQYWYELISSVGSVAGILLSISIISLFEVVYFFIFKFLILIFSRRLQYYYGH